MAASSNCCKICHSESSEEFLPSSRLYVAIGIPRCARNDKGAFLLDQAGSRLFRQSQPSHQVFVARVGAERVERG